MTTDAAQAIDIEAIKTTVTNLSLEKLIPAIFALVVGIILIKLLCKLFETVLARTRIEKSLHSFLRSVFRILLIVIVILVVAGTLGFNVTSLVALLSVISLAFSLAVQGTLSNIAGSIQLLTSHPFRVGDYVEVGGVEGTVQELGMIYTQLLTLDSRTVFIPNSEVAAARIENYTVEGKRRVDLTFTASYNCPTQEVLDALCRAAVVEGALTDPAPEAYLSEYGQSSISYVVRIWCKPEVYWDVYYAAIQKVRDEFASARLEMTYPHLIVHMDK